MYYRLKIRPSWAEDTVSSFEIEIRTDCQAEKGKTYLFYIHDLVTIPFSPVKEGPVITDETGILPFHKGEMRTEMSFVHLVPLIADRDSTGEVTIRYTVLPRKQPENYHSSPYFDLVAEKGGVNGVGNTFLYILKDMEQKFDFTLDWDLSKMPKGSRGVWTFGSGNHAERKNLSMMDILWTAYAAGKINAVEKDHVGFYWFDTLPFPAEEGAERVTKMFAYMSEMFHDAEDDYRIFARHNHFKGGGGTALTRSYIYGYGKDDAVTLDDLQDLLAHEMVHNWPAMKDEPAGLGTWYVEGSAEFYSTIVPMEMGLRSLEKTAQVINDKAGAYWKNPCHQLSNEELGKRYWSDRRCQRVPYARGILFLSNIDAEIRRKTENQKSLLDVELLLLKKDNPIPEDFISAVKDTCALDVTDAYQKMCEGIDPIPDPDAFEGHFVVEKAMVHENDHEHVVDYDENGKLVPGYVWKVRQ